MVDCTYIELNGLIIQPSADYAARLDGIMDFQKDVSESELFYDGAFYGSSKITSRDLTLSVIIKHQFNDNENRAGKQLNFILKVGYIVVLGFSISAVLPISVSLNSNPLPLIVNPSGVK